MQFFGLVLRVNLNKYQRSVRHLLITALGVLLLDSSFACGRNGSPKMHKHKKDEFVHKGNSLLERNTVSVVLPDIDASGRITNEGLSYQRPSNDDIRESLIVLSEEVSLYPEDFFKNLRLDKIVLCRNLRNLNTDGNEVPAFIKYNERCIFFNVSILVNKRDFYSRTLHHEIFHYAEETFSFPNMLKVSWNDANSPGFSYGNLMNYEKDQSKLSLYIDKFPGFLSIYSMKSALEDRAELFSFMMTHHTILSSRSASDAQISTKVSILEAFLENNVGLNMGLLRSSIRLRKENFMYKYEDYRYRQNFH